MVAVSRKNEAEDIAIIFSALVVRKPEEVRHCSKPGEPCLDRVTAAGIYNISSDNGLWTVADAALHISPGQSTGDPDTR